MSAGAKFNQKKFEELVVYIATRLGPEAALGKVKLAKLLMLSDFAAFARLGRPITGATYEKWEHGHFPRQLVMAEKDLGDDGDRSIGIKEEDYYGLPLQHITARRDPNMSEFTEDEIGIIEGVLIRYGHESARYLSQLSHLEVGWRLTQWKEEIPYKTVFLGVGGVSEKDVRRGEELASLHGWQ